jgi:pyruvate formate lyase activating enzyme
MLVKDNLMKLAESGADLTVRTPVIPGFNYDDKEVEAMCRFLKGIDADIRYELLPFHDLGYEKFHTLGMENQMGDIPALSHEDIRKFNDILKQYAF